LPPIQVHRDEQTEGRTASGQTILTRRVICPLLSQ
jgi:hypothetical protein